MGTVSVLITPGKKFFFLHSPFEPQEWNLAWTVCKRVFVARTWHMSLMMLAGPGHTKAAFRSESVLRDVHRCEKFTLQCMVWSKGPRIRKIINHLLRCQNILNQLGAGILGPVLCNHCRHLSPVQEKKGSECCQSWGFLTCPFCTILWEGKWAHVAGKAPVPALHTSPARCSCLPRGVQLCDADFKRTYWSAFLDQGQYLWEDQCNKDLWEMWKLLSDPWSVAACLWYHSWQKK